MSTRKGKRDLGVSFSGSSTAVISSDLATLHFIVIGVCYTKDMYTESIFIKVSYADEATVFTHTSVLVLFFLPMSHFASEYLHTNQGLCK